MLFEPAIEGQALKIFEPWAIFEQQAAYWIRSHIACDEFSAAINVRRDQAKHVEFIRHELRIGEKIAGKGFVTIRQIEDHVLYVFSSRDVFECSFELAAAFPFHELSWSLAVVIHQYGGKFAKPSTTSHEVFIDANGPWPREIQVALQSELKMLVHRRVEEPVRAAVIAELLPLLFFPMKVEKCAK